MNAATIALVAAGAAVAAIRLRRRARRTGRRTARPSNPLGTTGLVAAREVRERLRGRTFKAVTVFLFAAVGAAIIIPTLHSGKKATLSIGVVGTLSPIARAGVDGVVHAAGMTPHLVAEPGTGRARAALSAGQIDLVIENGRSLLVESAPGSNSTTTKNQAIRAIAAVLGFDRAANAAGLSGSQAAAIAGASAVPIRSLQEAAKSSAAQPTSVIGLILVFIMLSQYNTWTMLGIMEEKTSRVVEVLLATVRPIQLLAGKVLGIGTVALMQAGSVVAFALILADLVGSDLLKGTAPLVVAVTLVWLVLGYAFYAWVFAAAGSMAERQDQVQSLALPLSLPMIFGYVVALTGAGSANPSLLVKVLAYLPPTAPFGMPVLVATGTTTWWGFALSVAATAACTVGVARVAAGVYRRAVLHTGSRLTLGALRAGR